MGSGQRVVCTSVGRRIHAGQANRSFPAQFERQSHDALIGLSARQGPGPGQSSIGVFSNRPWRQT